MVHWPFLFLTQLSSSCSFLNGMTSPTRWFYIALTEVELYGNRAY